MFTDIQEISDQARIHRKTIIRKWLREGEDGQLLNHLVTCHPSVTQFYEDLIIYGTARTEMNQRSSEQLLSYGIRYLRRLKKYCV